MSAVVPQGTTRATFLARTAFLAAAAYGAGAVGPAVERALAQEAGGDVDLLRFLISVNHVESQLYEQAAREVDLSEDARRFVTTFGRHERAHIDRLELVLRRAGGRADEPPTVDFGERLRKERSFLVVAMDVEEVSIQAGNVAARRLESKDVLAEVAKALQIEARHSTAWRRSLGRPYAHSAFEGTLSRDQAHQRLRRYIV